jgi:site-specific DNA-methyltransferase (adenine-specific)
MWQILNGNNVDVLRQFPDNHFDSIVTDPPYGIDFLGKAWDANTGALETYQECLRVLKPGGHILAFSAARTYHHLAVTLEQAGFEIRDQIMWIYSSGFPKSQDIGKSIDRAAGKKNNLKRHDSPNKDNNGLDVGSGVKCPKCHKDSAARYNCKEDECGMIYKAQTPEAEQWLGWGTALKPAHEPIVLARKPIKLSIARNCQQWGVGALNIDATRVPYESEDDYDTYINNLKGPMERSTAKDGDGLGMFEGKTGFKAQKGKVVKSTKPKIGTMGKAPPNLNAIGTPSEIETSDEPWIPSNLGRFPSNVIGEILQADYQKYFYCPKVSRAERHVGFDDVPDPLANYAQGDVKNHPLWDPSIGTNVQRLKHKILEHNKTLGQAHQVQGAVGNNHPTVKPIELMKYLIKLITPPGGHVLDPFNGSGSTGCAAVELDYDYTGIELDPAYVAIAQRRIQAWHEATHPNIFAELFE